MHSSEKQSNFPVDLDWLAFCYVSGELLGDEREAFESRLADDQIAREAVARAVELTQAVALVESRHSPRPAPAIIARRTTWPRRVLWMSVGASAALVLVAASLQWQAISGRLASAPADHGRLAEVWSQTRDEVRQIVQTEPIELPPVTEADFSSEVSLPSWITAAVFNQATGPESEIHGPSTHDES